MIKSVYSSTVKIVSNKNVGAGFFISENYLITVSHNIYDLNKNNHQLYCRALDGTFSQKLESQIIHIVPRSKGDIVLIEILSGLPDHVEVIGLGKSLKYSKGNDFKTYGFPASHLSNGRPGEGGQISENVFRDNNSNLVFSLLNSNFLTRGYSGGPVIDSKHNEIVGMIRSVLLSDDIGKGGDIGFGIPIDEILKKVASFMGANNSDVIKNAEVVQIPDVDDSMMIGRQKDIELIYESIKKDRSLMITGVGGIGKTNVALGFIKEHRGDFDKIIYITLSDNLQVDFVNQVASKIKNLKFNSTMSSLEKLEVVLDHICEKNKNILVVLDNADNHADFEGRTNIKAFVNRGIYLIITSRLNLDEMIIKSIQIKKLDVVFCRQIFSKYYRRNIGSMKLVDDIIELVDRNTLLIKLIAKAGRRLSVEDIFSHLNTDSLKSRRLQSNIYIDDVVGKTSIYKYIVNNVYNFELDSFDSEQAKILTYFSVLPPFYINYADLLVLFGVPVDDDVDFWNNLEDLHLKGWLEQSIDNDLNDDLFRMHPLVVESIHSKINNWSYDFWLPLIKGLNSTVKAYADDNAFDKVKYIPFVEFFMNKTKVDGYEKFDYIEMLIGLSSKYQTIGDKEKQEGVLNITENIIGASGKCARYFYSAKAGYYWHVAKFKLAYDTIYKSLSIVINESESQGYDESLLFGRLGLIERKLQNKDRAKEAYARSISILENLDIPPKRKFLALASRYNNLGYLLFYDYSDEEGGVSYMSQSVELRKKYGGENWPSLGIGYSNLSLFLNRIGEYDRALSYINDCILIREQYFHPLHDKWSITFKNKSHSLLGLGKYEEAQEYLEKAIKIRNHNFPDSHLRNWTFFELQARVYWAQKKKENALEWATKARETLLRHSEVPKSGITIVNELIDEINNG